jgi:hypothetical protein
MSNLNVAFTFFTVSALMRFWMALNTAEDLRVVDSADDSEVDMTEAGEGRTDGEMNGSQQSTD